MSGRPTSMLGRSYIALPEREEPVQFPWPISGNPAEFIPFERAAEWRAFVDRLGIDPRIPDIVRAKFARAQRLYLLGWIDVGLVKAGELAALIALELTMMDRYGGNIPKKYRNFANLLNYGQSRRLTDDQIPMVTRCRGAAVGQLTGETRPTLAGGETSSRTGIPSMVFPPAVSSNWREISLTLPTESTSLKQRASGALHDTVSLQKLLCR